MVKLDMPHFLIDKKIIKSNIIELRDDDNFNHIKKSLRAKLNEKIKFIDNDKNIYETKIIQIEKNFLKAEIISIGKSDRFIKNNIVLVQSVLSSNDSQNLLIANAVQTGVRAIYPCISNNVSIKKNAKKNPKWDKIVLENFKQCERADVPIIFEIDDIKNILLKFKKENVLIFAEKYHTHTLNNCLENLDLNSEIAIVIGPEGGFSEQEFNYFKESNYKLITLGKLIYKAPNAVVAGVSNVISRLNDD